MLPEGWKSVPLAEICSSPISYGIVQTGEHVPDGVPCLRVIDIAKKEINLAECIRTNETINSQYKRTLLNEGDIILALRGEIGLAKMIEKRHSGVNITRGLAKISSNRKKLIPHFLLQALRAPSLKAELDRRSGGSALQEISLGELRKASILLPPLPEQKKIAAILSTWDRAIDGTEKLLANSQQQKKALMQQLLTGKKRLPGFTGEWETKFLGDIADIQTGSSNRQDSLTNGEYTFFDRSEDIRTSNRYLFDCEAVIVPGEGQDFVPKYFVGKFDLHQRTYAISYFRACDGKFIFYTVGYHRSHFLSQAVGSTVKSLRLPMFQKMPLKLPPLPEQKAIAAVLSTADEEITALESDLSRLRQEKKALMQQLLTGKRRVTVD